MPVAFYLCSEMKMTRSLILSLIGIAVLAHPAAAQKPGSGINETTGSATTNKPVKVKPSYAWQMLPPLGLHETVGIDTSFINYSLRSVPSLVSPAYATTGNLGAEGREMLYFRRQDYSDFFFRDALAAWLPVKGNHTYYNTRIPMTLVGYNTGGGRQDAQDRLTMVFSGNAGPKLQIGANLDYLYSKGMYANQADKNLTYGMSASYMGDRYELQTFYNHSHAALKENGGITDVLYITHPEELQGGNSSINPKNIPTRLSAAHNRLVDEEFMMNHRYKVGYWHVDPPTHETEADTLETRTYIPVSSFIWTFDLNRGRHVFDNTNMTQAEEFWSHRYLSSERTHDETKYLTVTNTLGVSLLEGFHRWAKFGLAGYVTHEYKRYTQTPDTVSMATPLPDDLEASDIIGLIPHIYSENRLWVGAQLTKQRGSILRYEATGRIGMMGATAGDIEASGSVTGRLPLRGDTTSLTAYGQFSNREVPYLLKRYVSNHFVWDNDFGKTRRVRLGGRLGVDRTRTYVDVGVENVQNCVYFDAAGMPVQHGGNVQVLSASLRQNFAVKALHWDNYLTWQTSSDQTVIPLPKLTIYSNLYVEFKVARVLGVQLGVDCDYYTKYYAPGYQPATMSFTNQQQVKLGNYPFMNLYANMKLDKARFYVMMSHINQGMCGNNYFAVPDYPLNPRRFQLGVSVDFTN